MIDNWDAALAFVWTPGRDSPNQGVHCETGDPGGLTNGGVIQATWDDAVVAGIVKGRLSDAGMDQLADVLRIKFWGVACCDLLPAGLDLLMFNGRMMTGRFPQLFQQSLGYMGPEEVDGWIGPGSLKAAAAADPATLINAVSGAHAAYLATLNTWPRFGRGWTLRLKDAQTAARTMLNPPTEIKS